MKLISGKIYNSNDQSEYITLLETGSVFLSFHHNDQRVCGFYINKNDLNTPNLERLGKEARLFLGNDFKNVELKIIGKQSSINYCTKVFLDNHFLKVKRVIRDEEIELIFLPAANRVRISKDHDSDEKTKKIKILVVDDSKTIRTILNKIFSTDPNFEVIGMLELPSQVVPFLEKNKPDVITLDIHMPEMDGVTLLKKIYPQYKIPCVMISSISLAEGPMVFDALENGAVDYIQKPEAKDIADLTPIIIEKIKMAASVKKVQKFEHQAHKVKSISSKESLVVIGSSTGGTEALRTILTALPDEIPPILIVQHIPAVFSLAFAKRMNDLCKFEVIEGKNGDEVKPNRVIIAPGGQQMKMVMKNGKPFIEINDDAPVNRFKPSVDYMFESIVKNMYCHTVAVILTGMGKDGAKEMLKLKQKGAITIAQNEESCVVFGMPREAIALGAAIHIEPLTQIAEKITISTAETNYKKVSNG
jgi:two-component system chemotaxis response regulator CheB